MKAIICTRYGSPDSPARRAIFEIHSRPMNLSDDMNYDILAGRTEGMSGADIKTICTEAGMFTIRDQRNKIEHRDFLKAIEKLQQKRQQTEKAMNIYL